MISPVEAAAEKYIFFWYSIFCLVLTLFNNTLISVLLILFWDAEVVKNLDVSELLELLTVFFINQLKHEKYFFANFTYKDK